MFEQNHRAVPAAFAAEGHNSEARPLPEAFDELLERLSQAAQDRRALRETRYK